MTHIYAYVKKGYSQDQIRSLVSNLKKAAIEGCNLRATASTVAVKEVAPEETSNLGILVLIYTAKGKGFDVKKKFARMVSQGTKEALGDDVDVKLIIKEHATDMVGMNGVLRSQNQAAVSGYEEG